MTLRRQVENELRRWLQSHHSVIGYVEARILGASDAVIKSKLARGEWARPYRGVYYDTAAPWTPYRDLRAACVATTGAVVSHSSAAWVWGLIREPPSVPELSVHLGERNIRGPAGVTVHRSKDLDQAGLVERNAIVVTNPLRTLVDLAGTVLPLDLTEAVDTALARRLVTTAGLEAEVERLSRRGRRGCAPLRRHLVERGFVGAPEPSVLEAHLRRLIGRTGLPLPTVEHRVGKDGEYRLDVAWAAILFAIEADGYAFHFSPEHKERDETRRNQLKRAGWTILVYSWRQVLNEPHLVAREITEAYRRLSRPG